MGDITNPNEQAAPSDLDEAAQNAIAVGEPRGIKRARPSAMDDDDDDDEKSGRERRKIEIKFISDKSRRHITFSKRKAGIMKKAYELSVLTGTQVLLLVVSETGLVYTFTTPKLQPLVTKSEGKNLIQACLNAPEPPTAEGGDEPNQPESPDEASNAHLTSQRNITQNTHLPGGYMANLDPQAQLAYSGYVQRGGQHLNNAYSGHQS